MSGVEVSDQINGTAERRNGGTAERQNELQLGGAQALGTGTSTGTGTGAAEAGSSGQPNNTGDHGLR